jgi:hypothetical protein
VRRPDLQAMARLVARYAGTPAHRGVSCPFSTRRGNLPRAMHGASNFPDLLRATEEALKLTPQAFAAVLRIPPALLANWKSGEQAPSPAQQADALDRIDQAVKQERVDACGTGTV